MEVNEFKMFSLHSAWQFRIKFSLIDRRSLSVSSIGLHELWSNKPDNSR